MQWMDRRTRNNDGWKEGGFTLIIDGQIKYVGNGWTEKKGIDNGWTKERGIWIDRRRTWAMAEAGEKGHGRWIDRRRTWTMKGTCAMAGRMKRRSNGWTPVVHSGNGSDK